ncbi:Colicin I receptor [bacterium HR21]|nr:Colicin I receptor [bacterium HR21]
MLPALRIVVLGVCAAVGSSGLLRAQASAVLEGRVVEAPTGEPLSGATVRIEGTLLGAVSAQSGSFRIRGVPPGEHLLRVSLVGYRHFRQRIHLTAGDTLRLTIALEPQPVGFGEVVVTAAKRAQSMQEAPVSITVVEARQIQERSFNRLDEVLRTLPGVAVNRDQVSIRGSSGFAFGVGSRTLLLLDGIPLLSGDGGEMKYDALPLFSIERVEVLKGAASALYGTAALGGVVNVLTREPPEEGQYRFRLYGGLYARPRFAQWDIGQRGMGGGDFSYARRLGPVGVMLGAGAVSDGGYRSAGDSRRWYLFGKARWTLSSRTVLTFLGNYTDDDRGNWIYWKSLRQALWPGNPDSAQRVRSRKELFALQWQQLWSAVHSSVLRLGLYRTDFENRDPAGNTDSLPQSKATSLSAEWQGNWQLRSSVVVTGGVHALANLVNSILYGRRQQVIGALYGQLELGAVRPVGLTVGIRLDWERTEGVPRRVEVSPRLGLTYASWFGPQFRANLGRAFRAPTVAERFATVRAAGFTVQANPDLQPERGWSAELGVMDTAWLSLGGWRFPLFADLAFFRSDFYGFIEPQFRRVNEAIAIQFVNITRARVQGLEFTLGTWLGPVTSWAPAGILGWDGGLTLLEPRDLTRNDWLRYRSRRQLSTRWTLVLPWAELQLEYRYQSRVERVDEELVNLGFIRNADVRVPIHVLDVRLTLLGQRLVSVPGTLTLSLRNALDYYYTEVPGTVAAPRQLLLQLSGAW